MRQRERERVELKLTENEDESVLVGLVRFESVFLFWSGLWLFQTKEGRIKGVADLPNFYESNPTTLSIRRNEYEFILLLFS